jgi:chitin synthase
MILFFYRGITASGKSYTSHLITRQLLHLSSSPSYAHISPTASRKAQKIATQITAFQTLLSSFGRAKTQGNPNASRYSAYTELHFSKTSSLTSKGTGAIVGAKVLAWGLDKSRLRRLRQEERTFHIFYQLLSGATPALLESLNLSDASDYALIASSGCYRLPGGPFSDDAVQFGVVEEALATLGFKERHKEGVWRLISALLMLGNIEFEDALSKRDVQAGYMGGVNGLGGNVVEGQEDVRIQNPGMMDRAARLGIGADDLKAVLTLKSGYVKKEVVSRYLDVHEAREQQDALIGGLYTLLFSYIVETANHKINPTPSSADSTAQIETSQIVLFDLPGFTTRATMGSGTLVAEASGGNGFTEFCINFQDELIHSHILRAEFNQDHPSSTDLTNDGVLLPSMTIMDNANFYAADWSMRISGALWARNSVDSLA